MGETVEEVAQLHKIFREDQYEFAYHSHQKAVAARDSGAFDGEVLPIQVKLRKSEFSFDKDEGPRPETSLEKLKTLRAVFREGGSVTAGNSSSINDGAALVAVMSEEFLKRHSLNPIAKITGAGSRGCLSSIMGLGPIYAVRDLCQKFSNKVYDFDVVELNEDFAARVWPAFVS